MGEIAAPDPAPRRRADDPVVVVDQDPGLLGGLLGTDRAFLPPFIRTWRRASIRPGVVPVQQESEDVVDVRDRPDEVDRLADRLVPGRNRREVIDRLDALFARGVPPDPAPEGFKPGRLLATSTWGPWDAVVAGLAQLWMPWQGKTFSPPASGMNRFTPTAATRFALRTLFSRYVPQMVLTDPIEAFPFRTWVSDGELDPGVKVLKIDYDFDANPSLIRHILDELVQISPGRYLGKVLFRSGRRHHRIGFFSLGP